ncbi:head-to-tail connector protein [Mycobacterium phage ArcherNM]|uniref:head-tail connector protein n=1 Tax=Mycobacterium phage ArcherNM TaxID=1815972 RepID=UPI00078D1640|nr:head-tail connector protein [Mycobacterium phage ArcherNM]AMS01013.1 head-to-tail connector protein [Mycobacterium phage ArcherNM]
MRIQSTANGGFADVDPEYAEHLISSGLFKAVEAAKPARKAPAKRAAPKTKPAPKQEPTTEE